MSVVNSNNLYKKINSLTNNLRSQKLQDNIGLSAERLIKKRTRKGIDIHGRTFRPYSRSHARKRERRGLSSSTVNLVWSETDGMMTKMDHLVARNHDKILVYFRDPQKRRLARYHNTMGAGKSKIKRQFFGLSADDEKKLRQHTNEVVAKILGLK